MTFSPAEALQRKYVADPRRDLLDDVRAGLDQATTDAEREALRAAAVEAAFTLVENPTTKQGLHELSLLNEAIYEAIDGPPPFEVYDAEYVDPVTGGRGKIRGLESFIAGNEDFKFVADAVAAAETQHEAQQIIDAAMRADIEATRAGAGPEAMTWSTVELHALGALVGTVPDDGTIQAAAAAAKAAEGAELYEALQAFAAEDTPESILDAEVARADVEVSA